MLLFFDLQKYEKYPNLQNKKLPPVENFSPNIFFRQSDLLTVWTLATRPAAVTAHVNNFLALASNFSVPLQHSSEVNILFDTSSYPFYDNG